LWIITFNGFTFGSPCTVSGIVMEMSSSTVPGSGFNNTYPADSTSCNWHDVTVNLNNGGLTWANYWGNNGVANDGIFNVGDYIIFYITIAPHAANSDLPNL
jgi:hypothetical protein